MLTTNTVHYKQLWTNLIMRTN